MSNAPTPWVMVDLRKYVPDPLIHEYSMVSDENIGPHMYFKARPEVAETLLKSVNMHDDLVMLVNDMWMFIENDGDTEQFFNLRERMKELET